jgi:hypothetical protein
MKKTVEFKDRTYVLSGNKSSLSYYIASRDTKRNRLLFTDKETGRNRAMRYARNQDSPFIDEQDDTAIVEPIVFEEGILIVPKTNKALQDFLAIHPGNQSNGGSEFFEYNPEEEAQRRMEELDLRTDAIIAAKTLDFNKTMAIARTFLSGNIDKMSSSEIKYDVLLFAEQNPEEFLSAIDDPDMDLNNIAARAMKEGMVTLRGGKDIFYNLKDNKKKILTIPHGMKPEDAFASWLHSDEGTEFYQILSNMFAE